MINSTKKHNLDLFCEWYMLLRSLVGGKDGDVMKLHYRLYCRYQHLLLNRSSHIFTQLVCGSIVANLSIEAKKGEVINDRLIQMHIKSQVRGSSPQPCKNGSNMYHSTSILFIYSCQNNILIRRFESGNKINFFMPCH